MMNISASIRLASTEEPKSLSMTASTPTISPSSFLITGFRRRLQPPRNLLNKIMDGFCFDNLSRDRRGSYAITASRIFNVFQPSLAALSFAIFSSMKEPMGLVGFWKALSFINNCAGYNTNSFLIHATFFEFVIKSRTGIGNGSLGIGTVNQWHFEYFISRNFERRSSSQRGPLP